MNLPKSLTLYEPVNGKTWVKRRYSIAIARLKGRLGDVQFYKRHIRITKASPRKQVETLIHESLHVAAPDLHEDAIMRMELNVVAVLDACLKGERWPSR